MPSSFIDKLKGYLQGEKFTAITDHRSILWLNNFKDSKGIFGSWNTTLQTYEVQCVQRKGALHKVPDAILREFTEAPQLAAIEKKAKIVSINKGNLTAS